MPVIAGAGRSGEEVLWLGIPRPSTPNRLGEGASLTLARRDSSLYVFGIERRGSGVLEGLMVPALLHELILNLD